MPFYKFERLIVFGVKCMFYIIIQDDDDRKVNSSSAHCFPNEEYYGPGARQHPPNLTQTERPRFIRSYYQLWGMLKINEAEWQTRLESMKLKEHCHLYEMSQLPGSFGGGEEMLPPPRYSTKTQILRTGTTCKDR